jgi:hypothetical protein
MDALPCRCYGCYRVEHSDIQTQQIIQAFNLPAASMVGQRAPRDRLLEEEALTESDKPHVQDSVKDLL